MKAEEIEKEVLILKGSGYLLAGIPRRALVAFQKAKIAVPREDFKHCGDKCFEKGWFREAAEAYAIAENEDGLIRAGHQLLESEASDKHAEKAYKEALRLRHKANNFLNEVH